MCVSQIKLNLPAISYFTEAITAIHRSALAGFEGYFSFLTAIGAHRGEHLSRPVTVAVTSVPVALGLPCLTAFGTAFGLVGVASRLELLLFLGAKSKRITAIGTLEGLVLKSHWMTSSLNHLVRAWAIQYLI